MAIAYRDLVASDFTTASPVVTKPTGTLAGDLMLMFVTTQTAANVSATPPNGWTKIGSEQDQGSSDSTTGLLWKLCGASEPATWTMTNLFDADEVGRAVVISYSGASGIHKDNSATGTGVTSVQGPAVTPTVNGCMIVQFAGCDPGTGTYTGSPDTDPVGTERYDLKMAGSEAYIYIQEYLQTTAAEVALDATSLSSDNYGYHQVALLPGNSRTLIETATLTDPTVTTKQTPYKQSCTETATLGHNVLNLAGIVLWEAITLTDPTVVAEKISGGAKTFDGEETAVLTDTIENQKNYARELTETATLTDAAPVKDTARYFAEVASTLDAIEKGMGRALTSTITLTESATKDTGRALISTLTLTESIEKQGTYARTFSEASVLTDAISYGNVITLTGTVSLADTFSRAVEWARTLVERAWLSDPSSLLAGMAARYTLDETTGTRADSVDGYDLADNGSVGFAAGEFGNAASFVDATTYLSNTAFKAGRTGNGASWAFWVYRSAPPAVSLASPLSSYQSSNPAWQFRITTAGTLDVYVRDGIGSLLTVAGGNSVADGAWHLVIVNWNEAGDKKLHVYCPSVGTSLETAAGTSDLLLDDGGGLLIGVGGGGAYPWGSGGATALVDEAIVWDRWLTPSERDELVAKAYPYSALKKDTTRVLTEASTLTDSLVNQYGPVLIETLVLTDAPRKDTTRDLIEASTLTDVVTPLKGGALEPTETVALEDGLWFDTSRVLTETLTLTDDPLSLVGIELWETGTLSDSLLLDAERVLVETVVLGDSLTAQGGGKVNPAEAATLTDSLVLGRTAERVLTEEATLADFIQRDVARVLSSTVVLTDTVDKGAGRILASTLTLAHSTRKDISIVLVEASALADTLSTGKSIAAVDTVVLADTLVLGRTAERTLGEGVSLVDSPLKKDISRTLIESATLTDTFSSGKSTTLTETLVLGDVLSLQSDRARELVETVVLSDDFSRTSTQSKTYTETIYFTNVWVQWDWEQGGIELYETIVLSDEFSSGFSTVLQETLSLADTFSRVLDAGRELSEAGILTDSLVLGRTAERVLTETLTLTDPDVGTSLNGGVNEKELTETLVLGHEVLNLAGIVLWETATVTDTVTTPGQVSLVETIVLTDPTLTWPNRPVLTETVTLTDPQLIRGRIYSETLTLADTFATSEGVQLTETAVLTDSLTLGRTAERTFTESASLTDSTTNGAGKTLAETVTLADAVTPETAAERILVETFVLDATRQFDTARMLADAVVLADSLTLGLAAERTLVETLVLSDPTVVADLTHQGSFSKTLTEDLLLADALTLGQGLARTFSETVVLASQPNRDTGRTLVETVALTDSLSLGKAIARTLTETVVLGASLESQTGNQINVTGTVVLSDVLALGRAAARTLVETAVLADQPAKGLTRTLPLETVALTDSLALVQALERTLAETITLTDSLSSQSGNQANLPETLSLSDTLILGRTAARTLVETATLSHTISAAKGGGADLPDPIVLDATLQKDISRTLTESATLDADVWFDTARTFTEGLTLSGLYNASKTGEANSIDLLNLADSLRKDVERTLSEGLGLDGARGSDVVRSLGEGIGLADQIAQLAGGDRLELRETLILTDTLGLVHSHESYPDTINLFGCYSSSVSLLGCYSPSISLIGRATPSKVV